MSKLKHNQIEIPYNQLAWPYVSDTSSNGRQQIMFNVVVFINADW